MTLSTHGHPVQSILSAPRSEEVRQGMSVAGNNVNQSLKVIVVMPAYNAEVTLERTFHDIPKGSVDEVILTDDGSSDRTVEVAKDCRLAPVPMCERLASAMCARSQLVRSLGGLNR